MADLGHGILTVNWVSVADFQLHIRLCRAIRATILVSSVRAVRVFSKCFYLLCAKYIPLLKCLFSILLWYLIYSVDVSKPLLFFQPYIPRKRFPMLLLRSHTVFETFTIKITNLVPISIITDCHVCKSIVPILTIFSCLFQMNQKCKVCGEPAAGFHFGAFTCEGCKVIAKIVCIFNFKMD